MGAQAVVWFVIAAGASAVACSLLYARYVRKESRAVAAGGASTLFAVFMLLFALFAAVAGVAAARAGR